MNWLDVAGAPGSGKSTICDPLWGPRDIDFTDSRPPEEWHDFLNELTRLFGLIERHPDFVGAVRMTRRTVRKMAAVAAEEQIECFDFISGTEEEPFMDGEAVDHGPYIQAGFVQRALGIGRRIKELGGNIDELRPFFRLMPVSLGVALLRCDPAILAERNKARENVKETAHENRAFMVPAMEPVIELAAKLLADRGTPVVEIDTGKTDPDEARQRLVDFADAQAGHAEAIGHSGKISVLQSPVWW